MCKRRKPNPRETIQELITREQRALQRREWILTIALFLFVLIGGGWCLWRGFTLATN